MAEVRSLSNGPGKRLLQVQRAAGRGGILRRRRGTLPCGSLRVPAKKWGVLELKGCDAAVFSSPRGLKALRALPGPRHEAERKPTAMTPIAEGRLKAGRGQEVTGQEEPASFRGSEETDASREWEAARAAPCFQKVSARPRGALEISPQGALQGASQALRSEKGCEPPAGEGPEARPGPKKPGELMRPQGRGCRRSPRRPEPKGP